MLYSLLVVKLDSYSYMKTIFCMIMRIENKLDTQSNHSPYLSYLAIQPPSQPLRFTVITKKVCMFGSLILLSFYFYLLDLHSNRHTTFLTSIQTCTKLLQSFLTNIDTMSLCRKINKGNLRTFKS